MVATVFELRSSAVSVSYYERDGYYAKNDPEHRQASFWYGAAAKAQGLRAHVRPSLFEDVLSGWVPGTDKFIHNFRHTHASIALRQGETVLAIGRLLGHRKAETTLKYTHPDDAMAVDAAETVGAILER